jgi:hypothetical protein
MAGMIFPKTVSSYIVLLFKSSGSPLSHAVIQTQGFSGWRSFHLSALCPRDCLFSLEFCFFFFWQFWGLNWGFMLARQVLTSPALFFCNGFFPDRVSWMICPVWLWTVILLITTSWIVGISLIYPTGLSLDTFSLGTLTLDPPSWRSLLRLCPEVIFVYHTIPVIDSLLPGTDQVFDKYLLERKNGKNYFLPRDPWSGLSV